MSKRTVGILLLLVVSEVLGVLSGHWYFGVFTKTVPPAVTTDFNLTAAYSLFLWRGMLLGLGIFVLALLAVVAAPLFRPPAASQAPGKTAP